MSKAPETIYLQSCEDEDCNCFEGEITWCTDKINDGDVKYIRADLAGKSSVQQGESP